MTTINRKRTRILEKLKAMPGRHLHIQSQDGQHGTHVDVGEDTTILKRVLIELLENPPAPGVLESTFKPESTQPLEHRVDPADFQIHPTSGMRHDNMFAKPCEDCIKASMDGGTWTFVACPAHRPKI